MATLPSVPPHLAEAIEKTRDRHGLEPSPDGLCGDVTNLGHKLDLVTRDYRRLVEWVDGAVSGVIPKQELARAKQVLGMGE